MSAVAVLRSLDVSKPNESCLSERCRRRRTVAYLENSRTSFDFKGEGDECDPCESTEARRVQSTILSSSGERRKRKKSHEPGNQFETSEDHTRKKKHSWLLLVRDTADEDRRRDKRAQKNATTATTTTR